MTNADEQLYQLVVSVWQALDDMGADSTCCCLVAKAMLRHAIEPYLHVIETTAYEVDYKLDDAVKTLKEIGWKL